VSDLAIRLSDDALEAIAVPVAAILAEGDAGASPWLTRAQAAAYRAYHRGPSSRVG